MCRRKARNAVVSRNFHLNIVIGRIPPILAGRCDDAWGYVGDSDEVKSSDSVRIDMLIK